MNMKVMLYSLTPDGKFRSTIQFSRFNDVRSRAAAILNCIDILPDRDKWHEYYDPGKTEIEIGIDVFESVFCIREPKNVKQLSAKHNLKSAQIRYILVAAIRSVWLNFKRLGILGKRRPAEQKLATVTHAPERADDYLSVMNKKLAEEVFVWKKRCEDIQKIHREEMSHLKDYIKSVGDRLDEFTKNSMTVLRNDSALTDINSSMIDNLSLRVSMIERNLKQ